VNARAERKSKPKENSSPSRTTGNALFSRKQVPLGILPTSEKSKNKTHPVFSIQRQEEEQEKFEKLKKDIRGREYIYDHHGNIVIIAQSNPDKLSISDKMNVKVAIKSTQDNTIANSIENPAPAKSINSLNAAFSHKKIKEREYSTEIPVVYKESQIAQPPVLENMKLASGVTVQEGSISKEGPSPSQKSSTMSKKEYSKLISTTENLSLPTLVPSPTLSLFPTHAWEENEPEHFTLPHIKPVTDHTRSISAPPTRKNDTIKINIGSGQGFL